MKKSKCEACLFYDVCAPRYPCNNFAPGTDEAYNEFIDTYIEERRSEFASDWSLYFSNELE